MSGSSDAPPNLESTNPDFFSRNLLRLAQNRFSFKNQNRQNVNIESFFIKTIFSCLKLIDSGLGVLSDEQVKGQLISE